MKSVLSAFCVCRTIIIRAESHFSSISFPAFLFLSIRNGFSTRYDLTPVELPFSEKSHEFKPQMKT